VRSSKFEDGQWTSRLGRLLHEHLFRSVVIFFRLCAYVRLEQLMYDTSSAQLLVLSFCVVKIFRL
jgi:hypothetical protein